MAQLQCCYAMAETVFAVTSDAARPPPPRACCSRPPGWRRGARRAAAPGGARRHAAVGRPAGRRHGAAHPRPGGGTFCRRARWARLRWPEAACSPAGTRRRWCAPRAGDGWYRTGDLGALVGGELVITGRRKEVIILRGRTFYAPDIEAMLQAVPGVHPGRAVALGVPQPGRRHRGAGAAGGNHAGRPGGAACPVARHAGAGRRTPAAWPAPLPRCGRPAGW